MLKKLLLVSLLLVLLTFSSLAQVRNVILCIGDGMGLPHVHLTALIEGRNLSFMNTPYVGLVKTHSYDSWVTDSAAAGTALATGFKTTNVMIGMLPDGRSVPTIFEILKQYGYRTAVVVTCRVTHATPAAFYAHVDDRNKEFEIAKQLIESETVDIVMGGGIAYFLPKDKGGKREDGLDLIELAKKKGYTVITKKSEMKELKNTEKVLALFAADHLTPASTRSGEQPMLHEMVEKVLEILSSRDEPFIIMIEGSQIDWEAHDNDIYGVWKEMVEFDKAVEAALKFALKRTDTLVLVTGDHETGGLSLSSGDYRVDVEKIRKFRATTDWFLSRFSPTKPDEFKRAVKEYYDLDITDQEVERVKNAKNQKIEFGRLLGEKVNVGWTTTTHTGEPVPIFAFGPGAEQFTGYLDNTDIPRIVMKLLGYSLQYPLLREPVPVK